MANSAITDGFMVLLTVSRACQWTYENIRNAIANLRTRLSNLFFPLLLLLLLLGAKGWPIYIHSVLISHILVLPAKARTL